MQPNIIKAGLCSTVSAAVVVSLSGLAPVNAHAAPDPATGDKLAGRTIFLDPGHQGPAHSENLARQVDNGRGGTKDCQTTGTTSLNGIPEHTINWEVAQLVKASLQALGAQVVLSRTDDAGWGGCVDDRARAANESGAAVAVSIHADSAPGDQRGFHLIVPQLPIPDAAADRAQSGPGRTASAAVRDAYLAAGFPAATYAGVSGGLQTRADIAGPALTQVPLVFVEMGNAANPADAALLESREGQLEHAIAIVTGVAGYLLNTPVAAAIPAAEPAPAEGASAPADPAPAAEAPVDRAPAESAPVDEAPADAAPVEQAPAEGTPTDQAPAEENSTQPDEPPAEDPPPAESEPGTSTAPASLAAGRISAAIPTGSSGDSSQAEGTEPSTGSSIQIPPGADRSPSTGSSIESEPATGNSGSEIEIPAAKTAFGPVVAPATGSSDQAAPADETAPPSGSSDEAPSTEPAPADPNQPPTESDPESAATTPASSVLGRIPTAVPPPSPPTSPNEQDRPAEDSSRPGTDSGQSATAVPTTSHGVVTPPASDPTDPASEPTATTPEAAPAAAPPPLPNGTSDQAPQADGAGTSESAPQNGTAAPDSALGPLLPSGSSDGVSPTDEPTQSDPAPGRPATEPQEPEAPNGQPAAALAFAPRVLPVRAPAPAPIPVAPARTAAPDAPSAPSNTTPRTRGTTPKAEPAPEEAAPDLSSLGGPITTVLDLLMPLARALGMDNTAITSQLINLAYTLVGLVFGPTK
ncbi:hypothetical protein BOX37_23205 [Nocardia mangyaensis]|uniref:MurNAc-LAA domain-containing protein n=1 Tax=Nocardia mangyaensis TaxID=2213200 RepID=A0A1J0VWF2_9NOCA|nr:hypothetical protein BOX37_23205 [Nocardia mangyaensis]